MKPHAMNPAGLLVRAAKIVEYRRAEYSRLPRDPRHADSLLDLIGCPVVLHEVTCSAATAPAEIAEVAEVEAIQGLMAAEVLLNRAEVGRRVK